MVTATNYFNQLNAAVEEGFERVLWNSVGEARRHRKIRLRDQVRVRGVIRRANRGNERAIATLEDCQEYVVCKAIKAGLIQPEGPGEDFDWDKLLELIVNIIKAIIELIKEFWG